MVTQGLGKGQMMKLEDWIILADGALITEELIPLPQSDDEQPSQTVPEVKPLVNGAKLRWTLSNETYRVAVQTEKGVLQVKSVTDGAGECHDDGCPCGTCAQLRMVPPPPWITRRPLKQVLFADEAAWKASLPNSGVIEITGPKSRSVEKPVIAQLCDIEKVKELYKNYKIKTNTFQGISQKQFLNNLENLVNRYRNQLNDITFDTDVNTPRVRNSYTRSLQKTSRAYIRQKAFVERLGADADSKPWMIDMRGKSNLYAVVDNVTYIVGVTDEFITIAVPARWHSLAKSYKNFAEMGNPELFMMYRRRKIPISL